MNLEDHELFPFWDIAEAVGSLSMLERIKFAEFAICLSGGDYASTPRNLVLVTVAKVLRGIIEELDDVEREKVASALKARLAVPTP